MTGNDAIFLVRDVFPKCRIVRLPDVAPMFEGMVGQYRFLCDGEEVAVDDDGNIQMTNGSRRLLSEQPELL